MRTQLTAASLAVATLLPTFVLASSAGADRAPPTIPFPDARLKIEYNATDGDAGLQVFLDAPAWRDISITNPSGRKVLDVEAERVIRNYGLTELFSESSEPPFDEFPFSEFKKLFPEGAYTFRGRTIEGERLQSTFALTHDVPDGPSHRVPGRRCDARARRRGRRMAARHLTAGRRRRRLPGARRRRRTGPRESQASARRDAPRHRHTAAGPRGVPRSLAATRPRCSPIERSGNQTLTEVAFTIAPPNGS